MAQIIRPHSRRLANHALVPELSSTIDKGHRDTLPPVLNKAGGPCGGLRQLSAPVLPHPLQMLDSGSQLVANATSRLQHSNTERLARHPLHDRSIARRLRFLTRRRSHQRLPLGRLAVTKRGRVDHRHFNECVNAHRWKIIDLDIRTTISKGLRYFACGSTWMP